MYNCIVNNVPYVVLVGPMYNNVWDGRPCNKNVNDIIVWYNKLRYLIHTVL